MKKLGLIILFLTATFWVSAQNLKPYILAYESTESISAVSQTLLTNLDMNGIKVVGQYQPAKDNGRYIIIFTSTELENAVKKVGGLTGFAAALRIGITAENGKTLVSYTNPAYWGNAYFRLDYSKIESEYKTLTTHLEAAMKASGTFKGTLFGSKNGLSIKDLQKYHYMMGMPYFDDVVELGSFNSYTAAVAKVDAAVAKGVPNVKMLYKISIPGKELTLYGFGLSGENGESKFLPIVDIGQPKHTAFLPYEVLVNGNEVMMLHGRFRIALSFPDLTMGTFSKIMSTPGDVEDLLEQVVK